MSARDALHQRAILADFWSGRSGQIFMQSYAAMRLSGLRAAAFNALPQRRQSALLREAQPAARATCEVIRTALVEGEIYHVSADMTMIIDAAARDMPTHPLEALDLPSPSGFVLLEQPVHQMDINGETIGAVAFSWSPAAVSTGQTGVCVTIYSDRHDPLDSMHGTIPDHPGLPRLVMLAVDVWPWGADVGNVARIGADGQLVHDESVRHHDRFLIALWRFLSDPPRILVTEQPPSDRAQRKQARRSGLRERDVRIVRLVRRERPEGAKDEGGTVNYSHRFPVKGHTRWLRKNRETPKPVWVHGYIKGDASLPLKVTPTIYDLR